MSYLFPLTSNDEYGVVEIGDHILVSDGVISIPQDVSVTSSVEFANVAASGSLSLDGLSVITTITPAAGAGISITSLDTAGPDAGFTVNNTGVISLVAGDNITLSGSNGTVTINASGSGTMKTVGVNANYTALATDEYIGATVSGITVTLPAGVTGKVYMVKNEGAGNNVVVSATAPEKIDGSVSKALSNYASITTVFRNGNWHIV